MTFKQYRMTEEEYTHERDYWIDRLSHIPRRKHFPRCVRYCLTHIAKIEAEYRGKDVNEELSILKEIWT